MKSDYHVTAADGSPVDSGCFVLRPFAADGTVRDEAALAAIRTYAQMLPASQRKLRQDIDDWLSLPGMNDATRHLNTGTDR